MKVNPVNMNIHLNKIHNNKFKDFLIKKQISDVDYKKNNFSINNFWHSIENTHQKGVHKFKKYLLSTKLTPIKVIKMQYNLNQFFLNQQLLSKFVELPVNSVKNITQSNV